MTQSQMRVVLSGLLVYCSCDSHKIYCSDHNEPADGTGAVPMVAQRGWGQAGPGGIDNMVASMAHFTLVGQSAC